ncbi:MAG: hypothetical protein ACTIBG_06020 [Brevibacterium aurantiacum]|uniref:hypothetical protein n=1 Tax=Brevibacterium aurantiacum TaxID=273384 RepID=UPI003F8E1277
MPPSPPPEQTGTPLRDGAVNPQPDDYLGPSNAGEADPHGPLVVNPGLPDEWPTYSAWRSHVIGLGLPDPGPHRFGEHIN